MARGGVDPALRQIITTYENPSDQAAQMAQDYLQTPTAVTLETLRGGVDPAAAYPDNTDEFGTPIPLPGQVGLAFIDRLDRWLVTKDNRPEATS